MMENEKKKINKKLTAPLPPLLPLNMQSSVGRARHFRPLVLGGAQRAAATGWACAQAIQHQFTAHVTHFRASSFFGKLDCRCRGRFCPTDAQSVVSTVKTPLQELDALLTRLTDGILDAGVPSLL